MIVLTSEQQNVFDGIQQIREDDKRQFVVIHGLAGAGKTTVAAQIARQLKNSIIVAPTGKAACNLRTRTELSAGTIHSVLYQLIAEDKDERGRSQLKWTQKLPPGALTGRDLLLDECSMVNEETAADLLRTGAFITAFGDPAQLPPVVGRQFFTNPDFTLQEIHRQALQSPIIRQAHIIRNGGRYEPDGDNFRVVRGQINDDELLQAEAILCWKNGTKFAINQHVRKLRGFTEPYPQAGETVMCLKNAAPFGVFNGTTYKLLRPFLNGDKVIWLEVDGHEVCVPNVIFENSRTPDPNPKKCISKFEFGYSMTVHKSQGSEFASVVLVDEYCGPNDRSKWLYTGITRAIERIIILTR